MWIGPTLLAVEKDTTPVFIWAAILIGALLVMFGLIVYYRKWLNRDESVTGAGFTLSDLRRLHKEGKMTTEEFEKAKVAIIGAMKTQMDKPKEQPRTAPPGFDVLPPEK